MTKLHDLAELGQSVWLDYIRRSFISTGELQALIDLGLRGMTSNPSIFEKAIAKTGDYDEDLRRLVQEGKTDDEIFFALVKDDIQMAADLFRPVYEQTGGQDGFVSLEVNPQLAHSTQGTLDEAKTLWQTVDRPNLMVKIPATEDGLEAITEATAAGVNVNITLIFSRQRYQKVMEAYLAGLETRVEAGAPIDHIHSVASFFVSRVDTKVDKRLEEIIRREGPESARAARLLGKAAVANARLAYQQFKETFDSARFRRLQEKGAQVQRPLWASTSTKNPQYSDIKYVQELIGRDTVNTLPQDTLDSFLDHGEVRLTIEDDLDEARAVMSELEDLGVSMDRVTLELEDEGVESFAKSFTSLMESLRGKREKISAEMSGRSGSGTGEPAAAASSGASVLPGIDASLGPLEGPVQAALERMQQGDVVRRLWARDHTLWKPQPDEISNRLGWLDSFTAMRSELPRLEAFAGQVRQAGYTDVLLLGMGGSSLAPELFGRTFRSSAGGLHVSVLDSTDPGAVLAYQERLDPNNTLFIVSTKSGGTEETLSFFKYFYNWTVASLGEDRAGEHFAAVTDPGSKLASLAGRYNFREVFLNDPNIGGRYSALSFFGLVPAVLAGVDVGRLLASTQAMAEACGPGVPAQQNPAARLGAILGAGAQAGRDKATFVISPAIASFGDWAEQLIAESTGKEGKGILPVVGEPLGPPAVYSEDRLFIEIKLRDDRQDEVVLNDLAGSGFPVVRMRLPDRHALGGQFLLWELATAIAGHVLGIHPFDQPNVESTKKLTRQVMADYRSTGELPGETPILSDDGIAVYSSTPTLSIQGTARAANQAVEPENPGEALAFFLSQARSGDYIALQAFIQPTQEAAQALQELRVRLRDEYHLATTAGFGPRFLHSTGQLHKGDAGSGLFIQFTTDNPRDVPIPDEPGSEDSSATFGVFLLAQARGDREALLQAGRRLIRFHFIQEPAPGLRQLAGTFSI